MIEQLESPFCRGVYTKLGDSPLGELLIEDTQKIKQHLHDAHKMSKENSEYLATLQEYLLVGYL